MIATGMAAMYITEPYRRIEQKSPCVRWKHLHPIDLISLPLIFGGSALWQFATVRQSRRARRRAKRFRAV